MDAHDLELVIAAILTTSSIDGESHSEQYVVQKYRQVLAELRKSGGSDRASPTGH